METTEQRKAFRLSAALHGLFFAGLIIAAIPQSCQKQPEIHVFSVVAPPSEQAKPTPKQAEAPKPKQKPKPLPSKEAPPAPAPKKMSYAEFVKKEGKPKAPKPKPKAAPRKGPKINTQSITQELRVVLTSNSNEPPKKLNSSDLAAIDAYNRKLRQKIDLVWEKPGDDENLKATVQFSVTHSGDIRNVQVIRRSGNPLFDSSIQQAFSKIGNAGPPPGGRAGTYQVSFS